jgi:hypothetical protein
MAEGEIRGNNVPSAVGMANTGPVHMVNPEFRYWAPTNLSNLLDWYDASNSSTISSSGGLVAGLGSLSGSGRDLIQTVNAAKPITGQETLNSLNMLYFDGLNDVIRTTASYPAIALNHFIVAIVVTIPASPATNKMFVSASASGGATVATGWQMSHRVAGITNHRFVVSATAGGGNNDLGNGLLASTSYVLMNTIQRVSATSVIEQWFTNGTLEKTVTNSGADYASFNLTDKLVIAANRGGLEDYKEMNFGELITSWDSPTTTNTDFINGMLCWKWGLQAQLPSTHTYRNYRPVVV